MKQNFIITDANTENTEWVAHALYNIAPTVMDYLYNKRALSFLRFAYQHDCGYLGFGMYKFVLKDNAVVAIYATYSTHQSLYNTIRLLKGIIRFFPLWNALGIIKKSASLANRTALPRKGEHYISSLYVDKTHRSMGIARWVMEQEIIYARLNEFSSVHLDVDTDNKSAIRLYHNIGFRVIKENTVPQPLNSTLVGTYRMQYQL